MGPRDDNVADLVAGKGLEHLKGVLGGSGMGGWSAASPTSSGSTASRWDTPPTILERRLEFEENHPEVSIRPPNAKNAQHHWRAEWRDGDGDLRTVIRNDGHTFFDKLGEIFD